MMMRARRWSAPLLLLLSGCMVGPNYSPPDIATPDAWHVAVATQLADGSHATLQSWWTIFDDPVLSGLIERARVSNLNVQIAASRILQARDQLAAASGARVPTLGATGEATRSKQSDDGALEQVAPAAGFNAQNLYAAGLDASWQLDLFGKIRRGIEAAGAQYQASIEMQRDVLVTLLADVATAYVAHREFARRIELAQENIAAQQDVLALAQDRYRSGLTSKLDVVQAQALLATTRAAIPGLIVDAQRASNRLAVLLGQDPGSLSAELHASRSAPAPIPHAAETIAAGVPADVLRQRPDVRSAERMLAAQTANIGVATAALYPDFSLTGFFGQQARSVSNLAASAGNTWGVSVPVQWALFDGGIIRSNIRVQKQLARQALLNYRQTVLVALEEAEDSMLAYEQGQRRLRALAGAVTASKEAVALVTVQYNTGLTDFNNVLVAQRSLFEIEESQANAQALLARSLIALYKALGGGWAPEPSQ